MEPKKQKVFRVSSMITISVFVDVEADNKEDAIDKALGYPVRHLCHSCSNAVEDQWSTSGELDGEPQEEHVVVEELS